MIAALLLAAAAVAAWFTALGAKPAARVQIRFAAVLFVALAVAVPAAPGAVAAIALIVLPIALGVLALASTAGFGAPTRPSLAAIALALVVLAALTAAVTGWRAFALTPAAFAIVAMNVVFLRQVRARQVAALQGIVSAACFLAASSAFALEGVGAPLLLFTAAGFLGATLALSRSDGVVDERPGRDLRTDLAISQRR
ncbi:MAG TPA: hypothetical protein VG387_16200 [Rhizomicrobium sp.]|nr:hypothetical protein [Rhizomicrobium sp.]